MFQKQINEEELVASGEQPRGQRIVEAAKNDIDTAADIVERLAIGPNGEIIREQVETPAILQSILQYIGYKVRIITDAETGEMVIQAEPDPETKADPSVEKSFKHILKKHAKSAAFKLLREIANTYVAGNPQEHALVVEMDEDGKIQIYLDRTELVVRGVQAGTVAANWIAQQFAEKELNPDTSQ